MKRRFVALVLGALTLLLALGAATALADAPPGVQTAGQTATSAQQAAAASEATQTNPSNTNISVRVLSPGNDGSVTQTNSVDSNASANNSNSADQGASQSQGSGGGIQNADQSAGNAQLAAALSTAAQYGATNTNTPVSVLSPGNGGTVSQSNDTSSTASSSNDNRTDQSADQDQAGGGSCGCATVPSPTTSGQVSGQSQAGTGSGIQTSDQQAGNEQSAGAASSAAQVNPTNTNISVRVLSPGNGGNVSQSNSASSSGSSSNDNSTDQSAHQDQSGGGCGCSSSDPSVQTSTQSSWNKQIASALSATKQEGATNENEPVRVGSPGNGGSVSQSNSASSSASSSNDNRTDQHADQSDPSSRTCGCGGGVGVQALGQDAGNEQAASAGSATLQTFGKSECGCSSGGNSNEPVRVWSGGADGSVSQSNSADSSASADNWNDTDQKADQHQSAGGGVAVQALGQQAENWQHAVGLSAVAQVDPRNTDGPTRVYSPGSGGSVTQSNDASSDASADNWNSTRQHGRQAQHGSGCGCGGDALVQALGQSATSGQATFVLSKAFQLKPRNADDPTFVWSSGNSGSSTQSNDDGSQASGENRNDADQLARELQA